MSAPARAVSSSVPRHRLRRRRARALAGGLAVVAALTAVGWLLVAPGAVASVRLFGMGLGWWAALAAYALGLGLLALVPPDV